MVKSLADRFWPKVNRDGPIPEHRPELGPCWIWTGRLQRDGYGRIRVGGRNSSTVPAHRAGYELIKGSILHGLEPDHLCHNRACVRWTHLEPVTHRINSLRGKAPSILLHRSGLCKQGHEQTEDASYIQRGGRRRCRICDARRGREWRQRTGERERAGKS